MAVIPNAGRRSSLIAAAACAVLVDAFLPATLAQDYCPPGHARYCENANVEDMRRADCDDDWGIISFFRDLHEGYHLHRRDKRRHLYYKAQNAHYELFYPQCPPDLSPTHGYHVTQWRPFPGECPWTYPLPTGPALSLPTPVQPPATIPDASTSPVPAVPPAAPGGAEPYFPPPVPDTPPPPPQSPNADSVNEAAAEPGQILLMSSEQGSPESKVRLLPPRKRPALRAFADEREPGWVPSILH